MAIRDDIKVKILSPLLADIKTEKNEFSIHSGGDMYVSTNVKLSMYTLDDIEKSGIVIVERYQVTEHGRILFEMTKRFGYTLEKFIKVMIFIIEKYNL